jgi:hypothetical protein
MHGALLVLIDNPIPWPQVADALARHSATDFTSRFLLPLCSSSCGGRFRKECSGAYSIG